MTLAEIGRAGQRTDPLSGDVADDGRLLSVAEMQQRLRADRDRPARSVPSSEKRVVAPPCLVKGSPARSCIAHSPAESGGLSHAPVSDTSLPDRSSSSDLGLASGWIRVIAGHAGAGASTVALAIADAAAAAGRTVRLVEAVHPSRSGLLAATSAELGLDDTGAWARGTRGDPTAAGRLTITRRANDTAPDGWPVDDPPPIPDSRPAVSGRRDAGREDVSIVDLGPVPVNALRGVARDGERVVIACRATIPGLRLTEQVLGHLGDAEVLLAVVGPRRWPGGLTASGGSGIRTLMAAHRIVAVPQNRRLVVSGLTYRPLPKTVLAAGTKLWHALQAATPTTVGEPVDRTPASAATAGTRK
jgi:hypothetical protein